ncbi:MAG: T9SS type A sorting domain-containing protein [candidate division WOR-3 bacterium]|nr:T9SS type A sorting domain-containing protein [candidate division WOR-3 bacterium]MCX7836872.1 T9SS type A sorting domain-containing protein [candidate division WOR-3 bacterium]MDW8114336.1 T9SS type A sorting domain-containing protein [candidate division WOR-3 bacterium]
MLLSLGPFEILPNGHSGQEPQGRNILPLALRCLWPEQILERILAIEDEKIIKSDKKRLFIPSLGRSGVPLNISIDNNILIYDVSGNLIKKIEKRKILNTGSLSKGVYFIHLERNQKTYKLIIY